MNVARKAHIKRNDSGYLSDTDRRNASRGDSMSRAHRTTGVRDDAIIAFILFCLIGLYLFGAMASAVIFAITAVAP